MTNPINLLRDARATGETTAALDAVLLAGYDRTRAERAVSRYLPPIAQLARMLREAHSATEAAAELALARGSTR